MDILKRGNYVAEKVYCCKKIRLMQYLTDCGFKPVKVSPHKMYVGRIVWFFLDTDELQNSVKEYYDNLERRVASENVR